MNKISNVSGSNQKKSVQLFFLHNAFFLFAILFCLQLKAQQHTWLIDSSVNLLDGSGAVYKKVHPGDTVFLKAGTRDKLLIRNFKGTADSAIVFMNANGIVTLSTNDYYGISISNCRYVRLSGNGNSNNFYGIQIKKVAAGAGVGIGALSSDVEIDHVSIENCSTEGIFAKTDPDCSVNMSRDKFTQFNTSLHDNYIANIGNEGMYIGSSFYSGMKITCNGKDTIVMPPVLDGVKIYNNIVTNTGWDGIQVSSAPLHCYIFNNNVSNDSQSETPNQMSGIIMGGGSKCDCNNNLITNGKGDGIENHGLGGNRIFNNIIVNAGQTYFPNDAAKMKHGILVSDVSVLNDSAVCIFFNDIINPKSDGIRFQSVKSKHNLIASNCIVNPGNYNLYELDNTSFAGKDAFVMIPNASADIQMMNNYFSRTIAEAGISPIDYSVLPGSPLINRGYSANGAIAFDFNNRRRPVGGLYDIGAVEYAGGIDTMLHTFSDKPLLFPNPVNTTLTIKFLSIAITKTLLDIYTLSGAKVMEQSSQVITPGLQELHVSVDQLPGGIYVYAIKNGIQVTYGKFIKL